MTQSQSQTKPTNRLALLAACGKESLSQVADLAAGRRPVQLWPTGFVFPVNGQRWSVLTAGLDTGATHPDGTTQWGCLWKVAVRPPRSHGDLPTGGRLDMSQFYPPSIYTPIRAFFAKWAPSADMDPEEGVNAARELFESLAAQAAGDNPAIYIPESFRKEFGQIIERPTTRPTYRGVGGLSSPAGSDDPLEGIIA